MATPARSRSISSQLHTPSLENFLNLSQTELLALFRKRGFALPLPGACLAQMQVAFLRYLGVDPKIELDVFVNTITATDLQKASEKFTQSSISQSEQVATLLASHAEDTSRRLQSMTTLQEKLLSLQEQQAKLQEQQTSLLCLQGGSSACVAGFASPQSESPTSLRLTGLKEVKGEDSNSLLKEVNTVLGSLSSKVSATEASRQGRPGARDGRAVHVKFASTNDCIKVLRTKSQLNRLPDLRHISINVTLDSTQQQQKNALWPMYVQARRAGSKAIWRGCTLYIDGVDATMSSNPTAPMHSGHMSGFPAGLPSASASAPSILPSQPSTNAWQNPAVPQQPSAYYSAPSQHLPQRRDFLHNTQLNPLYQQQQYPQQPLQVPTPSLRGLHPRTPLMARA